jgi:hypothetical protein
VTGTLWGYLKHPPPTIDPVRRLLKKDTSTMTQPRNEMEHRWSIAGAIDANLRLNALIEVSVELPQPSHSPAILLAHVSRTGKEDVGIEWCEFAPIVVKDLLRSPSMRLPL